MEQRKLALRVQTASCAVRPAQQERKRCDLICSVTSMSMWLHFHCHAETTWKKSYIYFGITVYAHLKVKLQRHVDIALKVTLLVHIKLFLFQKETCVFIVWGQISPQKLIIIFLHCWDLMSAERVIWITYTVETSHHEENSLINKLNNANSEMFVLG